MNLKFKNSIKAYIRYISHFSIASIFAFSIDLSTYALLKPSMGINSSLIISFISSQITLFILLKLFMVRKISNNLKSFLILILIGLGSLLINMVVINTIDSYINIYYHNFYYETYAQSKYAAIITKLISGAFGYLWSSTTISKILFKI